MDLKEALSGCVIVCEGKPVEKADKPGATYGVRPRAGGPCVDADKATIETLKSANPTGHFLWLAKPAPAKADEGDDGGKGKKAAK